MNKKFSIEHQYNLYLSRIGIKEKDMHKSQKRQLKATFYAAFGQILLLLRDDISELDDIEGVRTMERMIKQVSDYFHIVTNKRN